MGDGSPTREFLYVEDAAEGILLAAEQYDGNLPVNLGTGEEISIRNLAGMIATEVGFTGQIEWDITKPNGRFSSSTWLARRIEEDGPVVSSQPAGDTRSAFLGLECTRQDPTSKFMF